MSTQLENKWFVLALDDFFTYTFATHKAFASEQEATLYAQSIPESRKPIVAYRWKDFRD